MILRPYVTESQTPLRDRSPSGLAGISLRQVGEVALLGEAGDVGGLVVDDVRRGAAGELRHQLVVHRVRVDLDVLVTWMFGWRAFQRSTICFVAATVVGCQT